MKILRLAAAFLLFFIFAVQSLQPTKAYAWCCGCVCMYWMGCTCSGLTDPSGQYCPYCRSTDPVVQTNASPNANGEPGTRVNETVLVTVAQSGADATKQVIELMSGTKCFRNKVALSLLGKARNDLKYVPVRF